MSQEIMEALAPYLAEIVAILVLFALSPVIAAFQRWTGIQIQARHRDALHSAIRTGVLVSIDKGLGGPALSAAVREYVALSVPDALTALGPTGDVLEALIASKVAEAARR